MIPVGDRLFLDTSFVQAWLNERDQYHVQAQALWPSVRAARELWITEPVLMEIGNAFSAMERSRAAAFIRECYQPNSIRVVTVDTRLFHEGLTLYQNRPDKTWGLTDCISFVVMDQHDLSDALTADHHFTQAGFRA